MVPDRAHAESTKCFCSIRPPNEYGAFNAGLFILHGELIVRLYRASVGGDWVERGGRCGIHLQGLSFIDATR